MSVPPGSAERLGHLDALRGWAALSVVCGHYTMFYLIPRWRGVIVRSPLRIWADGSAAVSLFFVLSGLVLSLKHFRRTPEPRLTDFHMPDFLISRVCRIWLPYLFILLVSAVIWRFGSQRLDTVPCPQQAILEKWVESPTLHSLVDQAKLYWISAPFPLVPQAWTLAVELVLSLLVPVGVLIAGRGTAWLLFAVFLALAAGASPFVVHFAIGILLAKHYRQLVTHFHRRLIARAAMGTLGLCLYTWRGFFLGSPVAHRGNFDWYVTALGAAMLMVFVSASPRLAGWLSRGISERIGRFSYSVYLCHFAVLLTLTPRFLALFDRISPAHAWPAGLCFSLIASIAIATALYSAVELPSIRLGKRLSSRINSLSPDVSSGARGSIAS